MYGRILGFQRLARCPKWTPASTKSFTKVDKTNSSIMAHRQSPSSGQLIERVGGGRPAFGTDNSAGKFVVPRPGPIGLGVAL